MGEIQARATTSSMSLTEPEKVEYCSSCGAPGARQFFWSISEAFCSGCAETLRPVFGGLYDHELRRPLEERFGGLFEAARDLLIAGIDDEDVIYPTLAYASRRGWSPKTSEEAGKLISAGEDWIPTLDWVWRGYILEEVVDGVIILRRLPVTGAVHLHQIPDQKIPEEVILRLLPHHRRIKPEHIGSFYKSLMSPYNVNYSGSGSCRLDFVFSTEALLIHTYAAAGEVTHLDARDTVSFTEHSPQFLSPDILVAHIQVQLKSGEARYLVSRERGPTPNPKKLIPACVACYLRDGAALQDIEVHRLINQRLGDHGVKLPEGYSNDASSQLWRDAKKIKEKLLTAEGYDALRTVHLMRRLPY